MPAASIVPRSVVRQYIVTERVVEQSCLSHGNQESQRLTQEGARAR
jgi:hypothetical protein